MWDGRTDTDGHIIDGQCDYYTPPTLSSFGGIKSIYHLKKEDYSDWSGKV